MTFFKGKQTKLKFPFGQRGPQHRVWLTGRKKSMS
jgi:hypothetical protein